MQFIDIQIKSFLVSLSSHHCCTWFSFFCLAITVVLIYYCVVPSSFKNLFLKIVSLHWCSDMGLSSPPSLSSFLGSSSTWWALRVMTQEISVAKAALLLTSVENLRWIIASWWTYPDWFYFIVLDFFLSRLLLSRHVFLIVFLLNFSVMSHPRGRSSLGHICTPDFFFKKKRS